MKAIELTSLVLLATLLVILAFVAAAVALDRSTSAPPIFRAPLDSKEFSSAESLRNATSLDGLRRSCLFWAERDDENRKFMTALHDRTNAMMQEFLTGVVVLALLFSCGLFHIYLTARRLGRPQSNAL